MLTALLPMVAVCPLTWKFGGIYTKSNQTKMLNGCAYSLLGLLIDSSSVPSEWVSEDTMKMQYTERRRERLLCVWGIIFFIPLLFLFSS